MEISSNCIIETKSPEKVDLRARLGLPSISPSEVSAALALRALPENDYPHQENPGSLQLQCWYVMPADYFLFIDCKTSAL